MSDKSQTGTSNFIRLWCLLYGDPFSKAFLVKANREDSVYELKELILEKGPNSLVGLHATSLEIWRVHIPVTNEKMPQRPVLGDNQLGGMNTIAEHFDNLPENCVHVIVRIEDRDISQADFLKLHPPALNYITRFKNSKTTTISQYSRTPGSVAPWDTFKQSVNMHTWDNTPKFPRPTFEEHSSISTEEEVRAALVEKVFRHIETVLERREAFRRHNVIPNVIGEPDFIQINSDDQLCLVIEVKPRWVLSMDDLVETYTQNLVELESGITSSVSVYDHPVRQIFGYLSHNQLRFGVLTTYDRTWFLYRPPEDSGQLCISPAIQYDSQQPTLLQCLFFLTLLARNGHHCDPAPPSSGPPLPLPLPPLPPPHPPPNDDNDDPDSGDYEYKGRGLKHPADSGSLRRNPKRTTTQGRETSMGSQGEHTLLEFFDWESFKVLDVLGTGRTGKVFEGILHGEMVAIKICDLWQHPDYEKELLNEVAVYHALKDLQGSSIPRLKGAGYTAGGLFVIATDIVGQPLENTESLSDEECLVIQTALSSIHCHGFVHNDIRKDNILIQRNGNRFYAFIIDFAFSKRGTQLECDREKTNLARLLN